jgi:hypothetical protein
MPRKRKDGKRWIAADDSIFTGDPFILARAFLDGYVDKTSPFLDDNPKPQFKFLRPDGPEEARAREALVKILRGLAEDFREASMRPPDPNLPRNYRSRWWSFLDDLADLFDEHEKPRGPQRKLVFRARGNRRQSHRERDWGIAWFILEEKLKGEGWESTVEAARDRYGASRATVARAWEKYGKVLESPDD